MHFTLEEWAQATGGEILAGDPAMPVGGSGPGGPAIDSRSIERGQWFIALKNSAGRDGHEFLADAVSKGAAGVIVSDRDAYDKSVGTANPDLPALLVPDTTIAMGDAARSILDTFNPFTIAITGTVGKTSVKENIAHIASTRWPTLKTLKNWNTEIGLPLTVFEITPEHKVAVLECATRGLGQIHYLSMIARPDVAVITAIGPGHLSEFGSLDNVARAKWEIVDGLKSDGIAIVPGDSPYTEQYAGYFRTMTFGIGSSGNIQALDVSTDRSSTRFRMETPQGSFDATIPGNSKADLINATCAVAAALIIKVETDTGAESLTLDEIAEALATLPKVSGRMETITRPSGIEVIFDAYNSNPLSLENALDALAQRKSLTDGSPVERRVAILGDMLELGEYETNYHRIAGNQVARLPIDRIVTVGKLGEIIRTSAEENRGHKIEGAHYETTEACAADLTNQLKPGDLVLIKASRGLEFEKLLKENW